MRAGRRSVPPRGLTLRELLSLLLVNSQHHELWLQTGPDAMTWGHDSAPLAGLDIMLLTQQHLSVSRQAADLARQRPPVEYVYRCSHPLLQFPPQKWAEWIANSYAVEMNVPPRPDPSRPWSKATLNRIL